MGSGAAPSLWPPGHGGRRSVPGRLRRGFACWLDAVRSCTSLASPVSLGRYPLGFRAFAVGGGWSIKPIERVVTVSISVERRVGQGGVGTGRTGWERYY